MRLSLFRCAEASQGQLVRGYRGGMREMAGFLRNRRERMEPLGGGRRRTPGRRREEVAEAAGMSVDYYSRLEQARGPHPSVAVLNGHAHALELDADERAH